MGVWAAAAGAVVSGFFGSKSDKANAKSQKQQAELQGKVAMWQSQYDRKNQLEDRRYKEDIGDTYRGLYKGRQPVMAPSKTDASKVEVIDPFAKKK